MTVSGGRNVGTTATTPIDTTSSVGAPWRRADIQGLRAIAVLSVVAFHADLPIPGGFTGVDVFFVISGYVITLLLLREHSKGRFSFATFYARRAQRLLPALAAMVATVFVISWLIESPFGAQQTTASTGIGAMLLAANVVIVRSVGGYFDSVAEANPLLNTWSLSVEEQFYLVFPLVVIFAAVKFRQRAGLLVTVALLTIASFALCVALTAGWSPGNLTNQPEAWAFYLSPARAWEFGAGALLAIAVGRHRWMPTTTQSNVLAVAGLALLAASFWWITPESAFPGLLALLPVLGTSALIAAGLTPNRMSRVLSTRPAVVVGDWSYSIYLWHWPVIVFALILWPGPVTPVVAALISFLPALLSYRYLENPIRRLRLTPRRIAAGGVTISAVVVALGLLLSTFGPRSIPGIADLDRQRQVPIASVVADCFLLERFDPEFLDDCWFRTDSAQGWILLAGDSHAAHLSDGVIAAAHQRGLDVFSLTGGECPFLRQPLGESGVPNCDDMNRAIWDLVVSEDPPQAVILGDKGLYPGSDETVAAIEEQGIPVVWMRDVPRWAPLADVTQNLPCTGGALTFDCSFAREDIEEFSRVNRDAEAQFLASRPDLVTVDAWSLYCDDTVCSPIQNGTLQYFDNEHINRLGSERLTPLFTAALDQVLR